MTNNERARMEILLEEIKGEIKAVTEGHKGLKIEIQETRRELKEEINNKYKPVELAMKNLAGRVGNLEGGQKKLQNDIEKVRVEQKKTNYELSHIAIVTDTTISMVKDIEVYQRETKEELEKINHRLNDHEARLSK